MTKYIFTFILSVNALLFLGQTNPIIDTLYRNSYKVFEQMRLPNGMYRDSKLFSGTDYHPISVSNTGMGLVSLCIADSMGWINNAENLVIETLSAVNGNSAGFSPDRTPNGYFRHFLDVNNGSQAWNSEYSTIDTDILMCGALFAKKYFNSASVSALVDQLSNSIDFNAAIADEVTGKIFLSLDPNGIGIANAVTLPYNEYMIVAWLAKNFNHNITGSAEILWNNFYSTPQNLPTSSINGINVLTDNVGSFLSSFTHQFNYYLCHHFTTSNSYLNFYQNSYLADKNWWSQTSTSINEFGLGAGSAISSPYHADAINNNPDSIVSPHIIAGYMPIDANCKNNLIYLWNNNKGKYKIPGNNNDSILWRYSKNNLPWAPNEICGVDYSLMLFGISVLPEYLGPNFFKTYNDFFSITVNTNKVPKPDKNVIIYPNPFKNNFILDLKNKYQDISIEVINPLGQIVLKKEFKNQSELAIQSDLENGIYYIKIIYDSEQVTYKILRQ